MSSNYDKAADVAQEQLDKISPTMCYAKWTQVSMHLTNGMTQSCYHPPTHKIELSELKDNPSALHNTSEKKEQRKQMLEGERPPGCEYCWRIEDVGGRSDRIYRSGEYWAQNAREEIASAGADGNINPRYVEVNFNQACNFKCSYCSPHLSNAWEKEIKEFGPYNIVGGEHNNAESLDRQGLMPPKLSQDENPYLTAFWKWWPELYKNLEVFRMTGGEPLMDSNTFKVLDYVYKNPNAWLEMSVTSNMCPPKPVLMDKFIASLQRLEEIQIWEDPEKFNPNSGNNWYVAPACKNVAVFVSVDGTGDQAEYMRNGLDFQLLQKNVQRILSETDNTTITFINTFNALSLTSLREYLQWILELREQYAKDRQGTKYISVPDNGGHKHDDYEIRPKQRIWFDIPLLRYPMWQCIQVMPDYYQSYLEEAIAFMELHQANEEYVDYRGFKDFEIDKVRRNLEWMRAGAKLDTNTLQTARANFYKFFTQHDERRSTDFLQTFPEMEDWWDICREADALRG
jgi:6-pyruvoyl-tetrahydropterin synthase